MKDPLSAEETDYFPDCKTTADRQVCLTDSGKVITFGRNSEAQLGRGHARSVAGPDIVKVGCMMD